MFRIIATLGVFFSLGFGLSGCGVDGEPIRPSLNAGVGVSSSGVHVGGALGLSKGPFGLSLAL